MVARLEKTENGFAIPLTAEIVQELLGVTQELQVATVLRVASSEMSEAEWTAWVERCVQAAPVPEL